MTQPGVGLREPGIGGDRLLEEVAALVQRLRCDDPEAVPALQIRFVGRQRRRVLASGRLADRQPRRQRLGDGSGDLVLHREHVGQLAIVALRPQVAAVGGVDQLRRDPDPIAGLAHAAFEHVRDAERLRDPPDVDVLALERERGGARDHLQVGHLRQRVDDLFRQPVAEVILLLSPDSCRRTAAPRLTAGRLFAPAPRSCSSARRTSAHLLVAIRRRLAQAARDDPPERFRRRQRRGSSRRIALSTSAADSPAKARSPESSSYSTAPRLKMSDRSSTGLPTACSGDM